MNTEIPKYIKKRNSSKSQSRAKAKHKHKYIDCLFQCDYGELDLLFHGTYCSICGKIGDRDYLETVDIEGTSLFRILDREEIKKKYSELEIKQLNDPHFDNYIPIEIEQ